MRIVKTSELCLDSFKMRDLIKTFKLNLKPVACSRPKISRNGNVYYSKNYEKFRHEIEYHLQTFEPEEKIRGAIGIDIIFILKPIEARHKRPFPIVRPDLDNYIKSVLDGMKNFWIDDSQVCRIFSEKRYDFENKTDSIEISLWKIEDE